MKIFHSPTKTPGIARILFLACCVAVYTLSPLTLIKAEEPQHPQVQHYHAKTPDSTQAALSSLDSHIEKTKSILAADSVDVAALEQVHQISYSLEAATKVLLDAQDSSTVRAVSEAVEGLHLASEARNVEECRSWLKRLRLAYTLLKTKMNK